MKTFLVLALLSTFSSFVSASDVPQLQCFGTEPFWEIATDSQGFLSISGPLSDAKKFYAKTTLRNAEGTTAGFAFQIEAEDQAHNILKLNIVKADCNDGMSDNIYPYTALVDVEGKILSGCCN
ncbi:MAG: hypothetical protein PHY93_08145 [Bacteriovorax sp.]|nr:hypothetical protein [Bacteriovorax sp.]